MQKFELVALSWQKSAAIHSIIYISRRSWCSRTGSFHLATQFFPQLGNYCFLVNQNKFNIQQGMWHLEEEKGVIKKSYSKFILIENIVAQNSDHSLGYRSNECILSGGESFSVASPRDTVFTVFSGGPVWTKLFKFAFKYKIFSDYFPWVKMQQAVPWCGKGCT